MSTDDDDAWDAEWTAQPPWFPRRPRPDEPDIALLMRFDQLLETLTQRHADVLRRRMGMTDDDGQTLQQIGDQWGVSRERVRQVQVKALAHLQKRLHPSAGGHVGPALLRSRLRGHLRLLTSEERGTYLNSTFADAAPEVMPKVLSVVADIPPSIIERWLALPEQRRRERESARRRGWRAQHRQQTLSDYFDRLLTSGIGTPNPAANRWWPARPVREVNERGIEVPPSKLGRIVHAESSSEARLIEKLDDADHVAVYCEQPVWIRYRWFDGPHQYVPDVAVALASGPKLMVEVKPRSLWADARNLAKWNAATRWCHARGWTFVVVDERRTPRDVLADASAPAGALLERLTEQGPIDYFTLADEWFSAGWTWNDLIAAALRYGFAIHRRPLGLVRARNSPWLDALNTEALPAPDLAVSHG